jgi:hypothetical protein
MGTYHSSSRWEVVCGDHFVRTEEEWDDYDYWVNVSDFHAPSFLAIPDRCLGHLHFHELSNERVERPHILQLPRL